MSSVTMIGNSGSLISQIQREPRTQRVLSHYTVAAMMEKGTALLRRYRVECQANFRISGLLGDLIRPCPESILHPLECDLNWRNTGAVGWPEKRDVGTAIKTRVHRLRTPQRHRTLSGLSAERGVHEEPTAVQCARKLSIMM